MLIEDTLENGNKICRFPFFMHDTSNDWILGSIISKDYYSIFDLSGQAEDITLTMGLKNPDYQKKPDVPGGGGDDTPSEESKSTVVVIILAVVVVIGALGVLYVCI